MSWIILSVCSCETETALSLMKDSVGKLFLGIIVEFIPFSKDVMPDLGGIVH